MMNFIQVDPPSFEIPSLADYEAAVDAHLDAVVQSKGYGSVAWPRGLSIVSARSYAAVPGPYQADGQAAAAWSSAVWAACYTIMAAVQDGRRSAPTIAELIAELPLIEWP